MMAPRDHGGNLDEARARYGEGDWIDLSTGINRLAYPLPPLAAACWQGLPTRAALARLIEAARETYGTAAATVPVAGAQMAIQLLPRLFTPGLARIVSPTYNEHAASLAQVGWRVEAVASLEACAGADLAVIVNPNNPDGRCWNPQQLLALREEVGTMILDESFVDACPALSLAAAAGRPGLFVLRSFGKFYGLAGLRLGFVLGGGAALEGLRALCGPWPLSGPALEIGRVALEDRAWQHETAARLQRDAARLDALLPFPCLGGTPLFRLYAVPAAARTQALLARHRIWSRIFPAHSHWLRLGLPGAASEWQRLAEAAEELA